MAMYDQIHRILCWTGVYTNDAGSRAKANPALWQNARNTSKRDIDKTRFW